MGGLIRLIGGLIRLIWYVQGKVKVIVDEVVPLENAKDVLNKVMNREVKGKMTLRP